MRLTQFGISSRVYTFPSESEVQAEDNFRDFTDTIKSVIGKHGGVDQGNAFAKDGQVKATFWLQDDDPATMATKIAAVGAMSDWGLMPLYRYVDGQGTQYCHARLTNASQIYKYADRPEKRMRIPLTFDVPDPWWLKTNANGTVWGGSAKWGTAYGHTWGGGGYTSVSASGLVTSTTLTNNGNLTIPVRIQVECGGAQSCQFPKIQRIKIGAVVEEVLWYETVGNNKKLHIDTERQRVTLQGVARYDVLTIKTADWLTLEPGSNSIKILFENSGDAATVKFHYQEAYR